VASTNNQELSEIAAWFADRGFGVRFTPDRDEDELPFFWADLTRLTSGQVVAPMFGRGTTELAAARRARARYESEQ